MCCVGSCFLGTEESCSIGEVGLGRFVVVVGFVDVVVSLKSVLLMFDVMYKENRRRHEASFFVVIDFSSRCCSSVLSYSLSLACHP
jgi:hypothetical protein